MSLGHGSKLLRAFYQGGPGRLGGSAQGRQRIAADQAVDHGRLRLRLSFFLRQLVKEHQYLELGAEHVLLHSLSGPVAGLRDLLNVLHQVPGLAEDLGGAIGQIVVIVGISKFCQNPEPDLARVLLLSCGHFFRSMAHGRELARERDLLREDNALHAHIFRANAPGERRPDVLDHVTDHRVGHGGGKRFLLISGLCLLGRHVDLGIIEKGLLLQVLKRDHAVICPGLRGKQHARYHQHAYNYSTHRFLLSSTMQCADQRKCTGKSRINN